MTRADHLAAWHEAVTRIESRIRSMVTADAARADAAALDLQAEIDGLRASIWDHYLDAIRREA